jgi:hypothetical protein
VKEIKSINENNQHKLNQEKQRELIKTLKEQKYLGSVHNLNLLFEVPTTLFLSCAVILTLIV